MSSVRIKVPLRHRFIYLLATYSMAAKRNQKIKNLVLIRTNSNRPIEVYIASHKYSS